jgi:hypothetical protein
MNDHSNLLPQEPLTVKAIPSEIKPQPEGKGMLITLVLLVLVLVGANLWYLFSNKNVNTSDNTLAKATVTATAVTTTTTIVTPLVYADRLEITSPLSGETIPSTGGTVLLKGLMQDFFEGTMTFRFENANDEVLYSGSVTALGDNYGQMANFEQIVSLPVFPSGKVTTTATLDFFDVSMEDGRETLLLTVPLLLK